MAFDRVSPAARTSMPKIPLRCLECIAADADLPVAISIFRPFTLCLHRCGLSSLSRADSMIVYMCAARSPPSSLPRKRKFFLVTATVRSSDAPPIHAWVGLRLP